MTIYRDHQFRPMSELRRFRRKRWLLCVLAALLPSCTVTTLPDGTTVKEADRDVLRFAGDVARHKLGVPPRVEGRGK